MENNVSGRNSATASAEVGVKRGRGRPRKWADDRERRAAARRRSREWTHQLEALYVALVNAQWEEPELARAVALETDDEVVRKLIAYYHARRRRS